ncbi:hypothetical protein IAT38_002329 [Cryptococcus sp. DSM 104549]
MYPSHPQRDPPPHHDRRRDKPPSVRDPDGALNTALDPVRVFVARPGPRATADVRDWFSGRDEDDLEGSFGGLGLGDGPGQGQGYRDGWGGGGGGAGGVYIGGDTSDFARGWKQPRFQPGPAYEKMMAKERMLPPKLGGRSKKDLLGSINDSWGPIDEFADLDEERRGMFEILEDPPSRSTSPFKEVEEEDLKVAKVEAWERARAGTAFQQGGEYVEEEEQEELQPQPQHQDQYQPYPQRQGLPPLTGAALVYDVAQNSVPPRSFANDSTSPRSPLPAPQGPTFTVSPSTHYQERSTTVPSTQYRSPPPTEPEPEPAQRRPRTPPAPPTERTRKDQTAEYHAWLAHAKRKFRDEGRGGSGSGGGGGGGGAAGGGGGRREWEWEYDENQAT